MADEYTALHITMWNQRINAYMNVCVVLFAVDVWTSMQDIWYVCIYLLFLNVPFHTLLSSTAAYISAYGKG